MREEVETLLDALADAGVITQEQYEKVKAIYTKTMDERDEFQAACEHDAYNECFSRTGDD